MVIDNIKIKSKFNKAKDYISLVKRILGTPFDDFLENFENQVLAERSFEVLTQIMLDICTHIIAVSEVSAPSSYSDCMIKLGSLKILDDKDSLNYSQLIKMRNIIVHQYDTLNYSMLYEGLSELLKGFNSFQKKILAWLEKNN